MQSDIKLLDRIIGTKKELYLSILKALALGLTEEKTGELFRITKGRVSQIFKANKGVCDELTMQAELATKAGRLRLAYRLTDYKNCNTKKDPIDCLEYIRKEIEGDKPLIKLEHHDHFVVFRNPKALEENGNSRENIKLSAR